MPEYIDTSPKELKNCLHLDCVTKIIKLGDIDLEHALLNVVRVFHEYERGEEEFLGMAMWKKKTTPCKDAIYTEIYLND